MKVNKYQEWLKLTNNWKYPEGVYEPDHTYKPERDFLRGMCRVLQELEKDLPEMLLEAQLEVLNQIESNDPNTQQQIADIMNKIDPGAKKWLEMFGDKK